jgi:hypothetical protein
MKATSQRLGTQNLAKGLAIKLADDCLDSFPTFHVEQKPVDQYLELAPSMLAAYSEQHASNLRTLRANATSTVAANSTPTVTSPTGHDSGRRDAGVAPGVEVLADA